MESDEAASTALKMSHTQEKLEEMRGTKFIFEDSVDRKVQEAKEEYRMLKTRIQ